MSLFVFQQKRTSVDLNNWVRSQFIHLYEVKTFTIGKCVIAPWIQITSQKLYQYILMIFLIFACCMSGNGANLETFDEIFVLPWHKLHAALYWSPGTAKNKPLYSVFCCQHVWKLHFLGILFQIMRFSRSLVEWYNLYNTMRMKTICSMKCVKLNAFTLAAFTRPSQETFMDV